MISFVNYTIRLKREAPDTLTDPCNRAIYPAISCLISAQTIIFSYRIMIRKQEKPKNLAIIIVSNIPATMKTMTCKQLGGACDMEFHVSTFEEMAELSKKHGMEMFQKGDEAHLKAMSEMQELMKSPEDMKLWFDNKRKEFDALPENE